MQASNIDIAVKRLIDTMEGGIADNGHTNFGVEEHLIHFYYPQLDPKDLTIDQAAVIYHSEFWIPLKCDFLCQNAGFEVAFKVFQWGVHSGNHTVSVALQVCLNQLSESKLKTDGIIGVNTLSLYLHLTKDAPDIRDILLKMLNCQQGCYYMSLNRPDVIKGWFNKRIS